MIETDVAVPALTSDCTTSFSAMQELTPEVSKKSKPTDMLPSTLTAASDSSNLHEQNFSAMSSQPNTNLHQSDCSVNPDSSAQQQVMASFFRSPEPRMNLVDCTPPSHHQVIRKACNAFGTGEESTSSQDCYSGARKQYV